MAANRAVGQSLNATALVHEAFLRLNQDKDGAGFEHPKQLLAAASQAMRWILIDRARARKRQKRGGDLERVELIESQIVAPATDEQLLAVDEALTKLEDSDPETADLVKMKFLSGFTIQEIADATGVSERTVKRNWTYAKAWLRTELENSDEIL